MFSSFNENVAISRRKLYQPVCSTFKMAALSRINYSALSKQIATVLRGNVRVLASHNFQVIIVQEIFSR